MGCLGLGMGARGRNFLGEKQGCESHWLEYGVGACWKGGPQGASRIKNIGEKNKEYGHEDRHLSLSPE